jgi:hypothetical protein
MASNGVVPVAADPMLLESGGYAARTQAADDPAPRSTADDHAKLNSRRKYLAWHMDIQSQVRRL